MSELDRIVLRIRMMLAEIKAKEEELDSQRSQFQNQLLRIQRYAIYGNIDLNSSLVLMEEVEDRLDHVEVSLSHLRSIKKRAEEELGCLELTKGIEEAKAQLASLRARDDEEVEAEIRRLEHFISEASKRASESISPSQSFLP